ncbi:hypothetical protein [Pedobacter insulae]|uniref:Uncharacterized protein n=1 Tax=Pedobacter insulae TaxID=414048 RepID=A0A1I2X2T6_9SPHI|nr:hypothetical protein [Pedobacter insulae]SFH06231.1 hypothetical protein SAMN04489864_104377 [Pedobacter insulae]
MKILSVLAVLSLLFLGQSCTQNTNNKNSEKMSDTAKIEHYTFELSDKVTRKKVTFKNRYAVHVDLYDKIDVIPFNKLATFFKDNLK